MAQVYFELPVRHPGGDAEDTARAGWVRGSQRRDNVCTRVSSECRCISAEELSESNVDRV